MIVLRAPRKKDIHRIVQLADEVFGDGYLSTSEVNSRYLILNLDGYLAGFVNTDIWDDLDATEEEGFSIGQIETIAVRPKHRGAGLGSLLVAAASATLIIENVDVIECYATTWSDTGVCFIKGALERNGFEKDTHFPRMWEHDVQDYECRACKSTPCLCDATLYRREVNTTRRIDTCQTKKP